MISFPDDSSLRKFSPIILSISIAAIVVADLVWPGAVNVHWQMVALIAMLAVLPFLPLIRRVSYGELEAELGERVEEAEENVEQNLPVPEGIAASEYLPEDIPQKLYKLYDISHIAALAMLRTEIEVILREIAEVDKEGPTTYFDLMNQLQMEDKLNRETTSTLDDVIELANIAIHEKNVSEKEAREILDIGVDALERLYYYREEGVPRDES